MRIAPVTTIALSSTLSAVVLAAPASEEVAIDRPGADYMSFAVAADPGLCRSACEGDEHCQAYTYVHPGEQGQSAVCWLKSAAPSPVESKCCYSGVKQVTRELAWDRPGNDYDSFDLPWWATAAECEAHCWSDPKCVAFTYVRPHVQGPNPRCWLKDQIPAPTPSSCCDSGTINWR